jgi:hypothetical protein
MVWPVRFFGLLALSLGKPHALMRQMTTETRFPQPRTEMASRQRRLLGDQLAADLDLLLDGAMGAPPEQRPPFSTSLTLARSTLPQLGPFDVSGPSRSHQTCG